MRLLKLKYKFIVILIVLLTSTELNAQLSRYQVVGSYVYNFGNKINWNKTKFSTFNLTLISSDSELIKEFNRMSTNQRIHKKKINLSILSEPNKSLEKSHLIFIAKDKIKYYMDVFDMVEGKEILIVSEGFSDKSYVMFNLLQTEDNKMHFEINKPNVINQKLKISDEIMLMGGTEIDIAGIYLKSQHSLRLMELKIRDFSKKLDSVQKEIANSKQQVIKQQQFILTQTNEIEDHKKTLEQQILKAEGYKSSIKEQLREVNKLRFSLSVMKDSLSENNILLDKQTIRIKQSSSKIKNSQKVLSQQISKIDSIKNEIEQKNIILSNKNEIIDFQQKRMRLLIGVIIAAVIFVGFMVFAYRQNRKKSKLLYFQKEEINSINEELHSTNEELSTTLDDLKQAQQKLVESEKMVSLGVLSAGIAHEINNPINFVYAGINSLLRDFEDIEPVVNEISKLNPESDNIKEKLKKIEQIKKDNYFDEAFEAIPEIIKDIKIGADRTAEIVKGLRSFSRTDSGEKQKMNIKEGIETSLLLLKNKYKNHIKVEVNYKGEIPEIICYPGKINQVFLNIISNAIDAISDNGKIWITVEKNNDKIITSIKDTGSGMNNDTLKKVFDPFYTTKPVGKGTGLGLAITYGIIKDHNGNIEVKTEENEGSEFIITLPIN